jgi:hypothetical protein
MISQVIALSLFVAAVAPLSDNDRAANAHVVVVGRVAKVDHKEVPVADGTNIEYTATITVEKWEKQLISGNEKTVTVHFWQVGKRPAGWTGPQGQNSVLAVKAHVRVFARNSPSGQYELLEPNGWDPVP